LVVSIGNCIGDLAPRADRFGAFLDCLLLQGLKADDLVPYFDIIDISRSLWNLPVFVERDIKLDDALSFQLALAVIQASGAKRFVSVFLIIQVKTIQLIPSRMR
jgi:hypothetical protein